MADMPDSLVPMYEFQALTSMKLLTLRCLFARPSYSQFGAFLPSPSARLKTLTCVPAQSVGYIVSFLLFHPPPNGIPLVIFSISSCTRDIGMLSITPGHMQFGLVKLRTLDPPVPGDCSCGISYQLQASFRTLARTTRRSLVVSAPSGARQLKGVMTAGRGEASGVMISSKFPINDLKNLWTPALFQTGRVADCVIQVGTVQLRVVAIYGYHSNIVNSLGLNDILFQEVLSQCSTHAMPTIIAGDFNHSLTEAPIWSQFQSFGYVDLASRFASLAGKLPEPTYRGKTRIDFVLVNSQAERFVKAFAQEPRGFTDHASLHVDFHIPHQLSRSYQWNMPVDIASIPHVLDRLPEQDPQPHFASQLCHHLQDNNMDKAFETFALAVEDTCCHAHQALGLGCLPQKFRGRAKGKLVPRLQRHFVLSTSGDVLSEQVTFRLRQKAVRRLRELIWSLQAMGHFAACHQRQWTALLRAPGFAAGFPAYLLHNDLVSWVPAQPSLAQGAAG